MYAIFPKDPSETVDLTVDWSDSLGAATIASSAWSVTGLAIEDSSATDTAATVRISGGVVGTDNTATNTVTLSDGQVWEQSVTVTIMER